MLVINLILMLIIIFFQVLMVVKMLVMVLILVLQQLLPLTGIVQSLSRHNVAKSVAKRTILLHRRSLGRRQIHIPLYDGHLAALWEHIWESTKSIWQSTITMVWAHTMRHVSGRVARSGPS